MTHSLGTQAPYRTTCKLLHHPPVDTMKVDTMKSDTLNRADE
jgi:hypothetical protein